MTYKPELDGLRAFALILVLLCHMELAGAYGGFVGVDIFFVLSGFLITSIIVGAVEKDKFGFWNFFGRRLVRLYPVLLVVIILTMAVGFLITDPDTFSKMARSARYVLLSAANIFFNNNLGYFDQAAQKQIFLHTWSLGVEWQFYIVWPIIIWGLMKLTGNNRKALFVMIAAIFIASLIGSQWAVHHDIKAAYYMFYYRAFELALGGLLMFIYSRELKPSQGVALVSASLLTLLACTFIFFHSKMLFPGFAAFIPCLAAAACMWGSKAFVKGNFLRWSLVVFVGKASYSIYLVHWPLLVFSKYYLYRPLDSFERSMVVIASIVLGSILYVGVETRVNWRSLPNKLVGSLVLLAITIALVPLFYHVGKKGEGLPWRMAKANVLVESQYNDWGSAHFPESAVLGNPDGKLFAVIGGDSFSANMSIGFHNYLEPKNEKIERYYEPGCIISMADLDGFTFVDSCRAAGVRVIEAAQANPDVPLILIQAWGGPAVDARAQGVPFTNIEGQNFYNKQLIINLDDIRTRVGENRPIFLVASPPYRNWGTGEKECLLRPSYLPQMCERQIPPYAPEEAPVSFANAAIKEYAQTHANTYYIDSSHVACPDGVCTSERNSMLYFDGFHTSVYGAEVIVNDAMQQIEAILNQRGHK